MLEAGSWVIGCGMVNGMCLHCVLFLLLSNLLLHVVCELSLYFCLWIRTVLFPTNNNKQVMKHEFSWDGNTSSDGRQFHTQNHFSSSGPFYYWVSCFCVYNCQGEICSWQQNSPQFNAYSFVWMSRQRNIICRNCPFIHKWDCHMRRGKCEKNGQKDEIGMKRVANE